MKEVSLAVPFSFAKPTLFLPFPPSISYVCYNCHDMSLVVVDVFTIHKRTFSNISRLGYKHVKGQKLTEVELTELFEGLKLNELDEYTHILTGLTDNRSSLFFLNFQASLLCVHRHF
ncbi:unnamed protein product [Strongylus vulgaris]|uniref:Uncharacterized protein n=1 Tax=Strongylus vulgaris TaxID=40348 RepID=A0A3P7LTK8_STRVU|nr:unnamed protein product [Strongylus vulgaris]